MTNVGFYQTSSQWMTLADVLDGVSMICFIHDTRHINLQSKDLSTKASKQIDKSLENHVLKTLDSGINHSLLSFRH